MNSSRQHTKKCNWARIWRCWIGIFGETESGEVCIRKTGVLLYFVFHGESTTPFYILTIYERVATTLTNIHSSLIYFFFPCSGLKLVKRHLVWRIRQNRWSHKSLWKLQCLHAYSRRTWITDANSSVRIFKFIQRSVLPNKTIKIKS